MSQRPSLFALRTPKKKGLPTHQQLDEAVASYKAAGGLVRQLPPQVAPAVRPFQNLLKQAAFEMPPDVCQIDWSPTWLP